MGDRIDMVEVARKIAGLPPARNYLSECYQIREGSDVRIEFEHIATLLDELEKRDEIVDRIAEAVGTFASDIKIIADAQRGKLDG